MPHIPNQPLGPDIVDSKLAFSMKHFFANNDPPPAPELQCALRGIEDLVDQIDDAKREISFWSERLHTLEANLKEHRGVVSAIRRMPAEILGQIFEAHQSLGSSFNSPSKSSRAELIHLMLVCRGWRTAALSAHGLWANISIDGIDGPGLSYDKLVVWLARAGNLPRRLVIALQRREDCPSLCSPQFGIDSTCILSRNLSLVRLILEGPPLEHLGVKVRHRSLVHSRRRVSATFLLLLILLSVRYRDYFNAWAKRHHCTTGVGGASRAPHLSPHSGRGVPRITERHPSDTVPMREPKRIAPCHSVHRVRPFTILKIRNLFPQVDRIEGQCGYWISLRRSFHPQLSGVAGTRSPRCHQRTRLFNHSNLEGLLPEALSHQGAHVSWYSRSASAGSSRPASPP
ncbi:hypothetical protein FA13DRAFT_1725807 [Coprinellus micaceus]|uniref:F-box domain-containing protein n=1 Tax=Coprinellus micaceus TaxID=71717 RepID=A0A4Y7TW44_COPMI|nr:hypothetical protein FA13DRAFT_1725807 [Coprinellus micaceus]